MQDKRNQRSRAAMRKAMVQLMEQKPAEKITVKELCEAADVNRSTFYGSYTDLDELLKEAHDELFRRMYGSLKNSYTHIWPADVSNSRRALEEIAEYMQQNKELFLLFLRNNTNHTFESNMVRYFYDRFAEKLQTPEERSIFLYHAIGGCGILCDWLRNDNTMSSEQIADVLHQMSRTAGALRDKKPL